MSDLFTQETLIITQKKEWLEIVSGLETKNKYGIFNEQKEELGLILEKSEGFKSTLKRIILRSHRPLDVDVYNKGMEPLMRLWRPFFWFFSDMNVEEKGVKVGSIHRRFSVLYKKYDLVNSTGDIFATIKSPIWKLWSFPVSDQRGMVICNIQKKWQGVLKEIFTDSDSFFVKFNNVENNNHRKVLFAAAISIDMDYFENNQGSGSLLDLMDG